MNGPNKLECYITQGWKLPVTTTPAYWALSQVKKKIKCCEYSPRLQSACSAWQFQSMYDDQQNLKAFIRHVANVINFFRPKVTIFHNELACLYQLTLMFVSKVGAYSSGAPFKDYTTREFY